MHSNASTSLASGRCPSVSGTKRTDTLFREEDIPPHHETERYLRKEVQGYFPVDPQAPLSLSLILHHYPRGGKPPYHILIKLAIWGSPEKRRTFEEIKADVAASFEGMRDKGGKPQPWEASFRHKLSNERKFVQVRRPPSHPGRGDFWVIHIGQTTKKPVRRKPKTKKAQRPVKSEPPAMLDFAVPAHTHNNPDPSTATFARSRSPFPSMFSTTSTTSPSSSMLALSEYEYLDVSKLSNSPYTYTYGHFFYPDTFSFDSDMHLYNNHPIYNLFEDRRHMWEGLSD